MKTFITLALLALVGGCAAPRVVLPESGAPVRAGPDLRGHVYVFTADKKWELSGNQVSVPEGWYCWNPEGTNGLTKGK